MVVQYLREGRVGPVEVPEVRAAEASADAVEAAGKARIVAEKHLALAVDLPTDRREPINGVAQGLPPLLNPDLLAQEGCRPGQGDEGLPWHLLLGPAAPEAAAVGRVERRSPLEATCQRIEVLELSEVVDLLLKERVLRGPRRQGRNRSGDVPRPGRRR